MARPKASIPQRLLEAEVAINNTLANPDILAAVTPFGYTQANMEAARTLYKETLELVEKQKMEYGEQFEATQTVQKAWDAASLAYSAALKIARIAFRDNLTAQNSLSLNGTRKKSLNGWLDQARSFYNNMLRSSEFIAAMNAYSYTQEKLEAESALVQAVATASEVQDHERGEAQTVTKLRDAKLDELDQWLADYKAIAQVALAASPQTMEELGWVVPS